ncbi:MAG: NUDIX domain-containing protein [Actinomycetota bacterium]|nr:NUDIX domain-containing protein [Actinomycetota bacterium]
MIKEATASTFVFRKDPGGAWETALVWHPRLECWLPSGGHVESDESTAEAARREAREETGLDVRLLPGPAVPVPAGFPHATVCAPWWIVEMRELTTTPVSRMFISTMFLSLSRPTAARPRRQRTRHGGSRPGRLTMQPGSRRTPGCRPGSCSGGSPE